MFPRFRPLARSASLLALILALAPDARAGVNKDGRLVLHVTKDLALTRDGEDRDLRNCESAVTSLPGDDSEVIIFLLAAFPDWVSPSVAGVLFGIDYDTTVLRSGRGIDYGWELPTSDWPAPGSGNAITTGNAAPIDDRVTTVYWFSAYAYQGTSFTLTDHPSQGRPQFADDTVPSVLDEVRIEDLGKVGFGIPGYNPCLANVPTGACCYPDGVCVIGAEIACEDEEGTYLGDDSGCDPYACAGACCLESGDCSQELPQDCDRYGGWFRGVRVRCTPNGCLNERVTWGELKRAYREDY